MELYVNDFGTTWWQLNHITPSEVELMIINEAMFTDSLLEIVHVLNITKCFKHQIKSVLMLSGLLLLSVVASILNNHR